MLRTAPDPDPDDRVVRLSAQMIGLRFTARGAGRRAALVAASRLGQVEDDVLGHERAGDVDRRPGAAVTTTVSVTLPIARRTASDAV